MTHPTLDDSLRSSEQDEKGSEMIRARMVSTLLGLSLTASFLPGTPSAAVSPSTAAAASSVKASTLSKLRAVKKKSVSPKRYKSQVAKSKAKLGKYKHLLPSSHKVHTSKVRAFRFSKDRIVIAFPILARGYSGGALSFVFTKSKLKTSQQLILNKTNRGRTGSLRIYTNGKLKTKKSITISPTPSPLNLGKQDSDSFTDCWNSMPGWITDLVSLICTVSCLAAESPPTLIMCVTCLVGLAGIYASFALKCANDELKYT